MTKSRYLWSVINPSLFTLEEITSFLETTDQTCDHLLALREQMIKSGLPTFHLGTAIRELQDNRNLLLLSGYKKFKTDDYTHLELQMVVKKMARKNKPGWRRRMNNFWIRCRGFIDNRNPQIEKQLLKEVPQTINLGECAAFPKKVTLPAG